MHSIRTPNLNFDQRHYTYTGLTLILSLWKADLYTLKTLRDHLLKAQARARTWLLQYTWNQFPS